MKVNVGGKSPKMNIQDSETERLFRILTQANKGYKQNRPYASRMAYCYTANWFGMNREQDSVTNGAMKLYQGIGNGVEAEIISAYQRAKLLLGTQVPLPTPNGIEIGGYIDMVALNASGKPSVYEIKTCTNIPSEIKAEHAAQVAVYHTFSGLDCYVIYVSRKVQNFPDPTPLVRVFEFNPLEHKDKISNTFLSLVTQGSSLPPPRPSHFRENNECGFCTWKSFCWNEANFMQARDFIRFTGDAEKLSEKVLSERKKFKKATLMACEASVPSFQLSLLQSFIAEAK